MPPAERPVNRVRSFHFSAQIVYAVDLVEHFPGIFLKKRIETGLGWAMMRTRLGHSPLLRPRFLNIWKQSPTSAILNPCRPPPQIVLCHLLVFLHPLAQRMLVLIAIQTQRAHIFHVLVFLGFVFFCSKWPVPASNSPRHLHQPLSLLIDDDLWEFVGF